MSGNEVEIIVVLHAFRNYKKGDVVRDEATIANIVATVSANNFVLTSAPAIPTSAENSQ